MSDKVTLKDISLKDITLDKLPLIKKLREDHFNTKTDVCIERAKLITEYLKEHDKDPEDFQVIRAKAINHFLSEKEALFYDGNLLGGSTTSKKIGAPIYPEFMGTTIWPELETISRRSINPQTLFSSDAEICNFDIFPYWLDRTALEVTRKRFNNPRCLQIMEKIVYYLNGKAGCISHCVPSYEKALSKGLRHIINEAVEKEKELKSLEVNEDNKSKIEFYQSVQIVLQGIINYANKLSTTAKELIKYANGSAQKENLEIIADICAHVPENPARTYREAVNSLWLCQVGIHAENINMAMSPGRVDQVLYPYYKKDFEENGLSIEEATNISCCLWLKIADNTNLVPETAEKLWGGAGSTPAVTLGGIDMQGDDSVNDLTYVFLKVTELMKLRDPSVNARYNYEKNTKEYRDRVSEVIINTKAIPAFHNDIADIKTIVNQGVSEEHARDYAIVGCVELASTGRDYVASSSIMFNLYSAMELTLFNGKKFSMGDEQIGPETGDPSGFKTFDEFWEAFKIQLKWLLENAVDLNEKFGKVHQEMLPTPLLSAFFDGPMESGKDLIFGGALYNSSGVSFVAYPDVCDSLNAIEEGVFNSKKMTMQEMIEAIKVDFAKPYDKYLTNLKKEAPKFGTDDPIAKKNSTNLVKFIYEVLQSHTTYRNGKYRPAYWTMTTHAGQGKLAGAMPSGRQAKTVFSSGITPASQVAPNLTEALNSVALLCKDNYIPGGIALNIKYTPELDTGNSNGYHKKFGDLVEGYFKQGGMQVQFNVQTYKTLIEAKKNPKKYPEMIVRVSGYSAYFKDLSDPMKDELITRTQYNLMTGKLVPLPDTFEEG